MSRWTHLSGRIIIHKSRRCALKDVAYLIFDDHTISFEQEYDGDCYVYEVMINIREDGERAWKMINKFVKHLKDSYNAFCDLKAEVSL